MAKKPILTKDQALVHLALASHSLVMLGHDELATELSKISLKLMSTRGWPIKLKK